MTNQKHMRNLKNNKVLKSDQEKACQSYEAANSKLDTFETSASFNMLKLSFSHF